MVCKHRCVYREQRAPTARVDCLSPAPFVQAPARGQMLHSAVGAWIQECDEALPSREVAVADRP